jgi:thiol-disulfide isomerase/thioredoxin
VGAALAVAGLAAVSACSGSGSGSSAQTGYESTNGSVTLTTYPVGSRQTAPDLSGTTLTGTGLDVASLRGKIVVVNLWGSWCGPCRDEAQGLEAAYTADAGKGVAFVGIDTRDGNASASAFLRTEHITYPSLVDTTGTLALKFADIVPAETVPSTVILDREGRVAARDINEITYTQLMSVLGGLIKES